MTRKTPKFTVVAIVKAYGQNEGLGIALYLELNTNEKEKAVQPGILTTEKTTDPSIVTAVLSNYIRVIRWLLEVLINFSFNDITLLDLSQDAKKPNLI